MHYALLLGTEPKYKLDADGNKIVVYVDESTTPPTEYYEEEDGSDRKIYSEPVAFYGNIAMSGGDVMRTEYGVNEANYEAVLTVDKGLLPIDETSLIWFKTLPVLNEFGEADEATADYRVLKVSPSLNIDRYILAKVVK